MRLQHNSIFSKQNQIWLKKNTVGRLYEFVFTWYMYDVCVALCLFLSVGSVCASTHSVLSMGNTSCHIEKKSIIMLFFYGKLLFTFGESSFYFELNTMVPGHWSQSGLITPPQNMD